MRDDRFEWDDANAASNLAKHKVSFELPRLVFDDPHAVDQPDDDPEEDRWHCLGHTASAARPSIFFWWYISNAGLGHASTSDLT
jgi:uncharacterized DUF497 family protein